MKNKNNVYVEVESKEQAETYRKVLEAMGEPTSEWAFRPLQSSKYLVFNNASQNWITNQTNQEKNCVSFGELIDLLQRKPLLISEDGVELFEDSKYYQAVLSLGKWELNIFRSGNPYTLEADDNVILNPEENKAFSTKQAALEWIESQKPKEKYLHLGLNTLKITANNISGLEKLSWLSDNDIEFIYKAMEELKNGR